MIECQHCAAIAPVFQQAVSTYPSRRVLFAELDGGKAKELIKELGIPYYPAIVYFEAGSTDGVLFKGQRTAESIIDFVEKEQLSKSKGMAHADEEPVERTPRHSCPVDDEDEPPKGPYPPIPAKSGSTQLNNVAQLDQLIGAGRPVFVKFYYPTCGACRKLGPIWEGFAQRIAAENIDVVVASFNGRLDESVLDRYTHLH